MLIDFTISNFRSIKETITLSMEPGERLTKYGETNVRNVGGEKVLKNAIVFGPNGAGKSNIVKALLQMAEMVFNPTSKIVDQLNYQPFRLCDSSLGQGTYFKVRFIYSNRIYAYEFEFNKTTVIMEKLTYRKIGKKSVEHVHFERNGQNIFNYPLELEPLVKMTRENNLFLSVAQDKNDEHSGNVIKWFADEVIFLNARKMNGPRFERYYDLLSSENKKDKFKYFMNILGVNITGVEVKTSDSKVPDRVLTAFRLLFDDKNLEVNKDVQELYLNYKKYDSDGNVIGDSSISFDSESSGTKRLIGIVLAMLESDNRGKLIIIDEFDDSIHTELSRALIKLFNSKEGTNQYLLTSHEIGLMDCDLRVDQIYLIEKQFNGVSQLYSLFDFNELYGSKRSDISYATRYMKGHFGALPRFRIENIMSNSSEG